MNIVSWAGAEAEGGWGSILRTLRFWDPSSFLRNKPQQNSCHREGAGPYAGGTEPRIIPGLRMLFFNLIFFLSSLFNTETVILILPELGKVWERQVIFVPALWLPCRGEGSAVQRLHPWVFEDPLEYRF